MKQQHSLLNRGPCKEWPKARDTPWFEGEPPEPQPEPPSVQPTPVQEPPPMPKPKGTSLKHQVTVVIVNFKTKGLLKTAYRTFRQFYPNIRVILVDNHSEDASTEYVKEVGGRPNNTAILMDHNVGHGPAMNKAIRQVDTPYVFTLDTDTETLKGGFLEAMIARMKADDKLYAVGWKRWVDKLSGVPKEWHLETPPSNRFVAYIHPSAALYRVAMYHTLTPFFHHGAPCLDNMKEAARRKLKVESFPIRDYVKHLRAGTRRMYDGRWDPTERTPKKPWKARADYPI